MSAAAAAVAAADAAALAALPFPPHPPLVGSEAGSFAEGTIKTRLPAIMDTVLADLQLLAETPAFASDDARAQIAAAEAAVREMQAEMPADARVAPIEAPGSGSGGGAAPAHLGPITAQTNAAVAAWQAKGAREGFSGGWLGLPWLTVECYLYARLAAIMARQPLLAAAKYDPFARQKMAALLKSGAAVAELAAAGEALLSEYPSPGSSGASSGGSSGASGSEAATKRHLREVFMYALWGNKTDLSMLVDASRLDVSASVRGAAAGAGAGGNLIVDEFEAVWAALAKNGGKQGVLLLLLLLLLRYICTVDVCEGAGEASCWSWAMHHARSLALLTIDIKRAADAVTTQNKAGGRLDVILDNAGLELYTDLLLADFLVVRCRAVRAVLCMLCMLCRCGALLLLLLAIAVLCMLCARSERAQLIFPGSKHMPSASQAMHHHLLKTTPNSRPASPTPSCCTASCCRGSSPTRPRPTSPPSSTRSTRRRRRPAWRPPRRSGARSGASRRAGARTSQRAAGRTGTTPFGRRRSRFGGWRRRRRTCTRTWRGRACSSSRATSTTASSRTTAAGRSRRRLRPRWGRSGRRRS